MLWHLFGSFAVILHLYPTYVVCAIRSNSCCHFAEWTTDVVLGESQPVVTYHAAHKIGASLL